MCHGLHHNRMPAAKQLLLKGLSSSATESNCQSQTTCAAPNDRKGVKPADIIAIDERPVSAHCRRSPPG
jgi:hypothetical protein